MESKLEHKLKERLRSPLKRIRPILSQYNGAEYVFNGKRFLSFQSNDYLSLSDHPEIKGAIKLAIEQYGLGSQASPLLGGYSVSHQALEEELAEFVGKPRVLLCSSGYMANMSVLSSLCEPEDRLYFDRLNHASLVDAAKMRVKRIYRYPHKNVDYLEEKLKRSGNQTKPQITDSNCWIITDAVFSMDGDIAPLPALCRLARNYRAKLVVDDAHGFGTIGKEGKGSLAYLNISADEVDVIVGTLGKAFGCFGAFVAADHNTIEHLIQFARPYIYSTALPPALAEAARVSLRLIKKEEWRREKCLALSAYLREKINALGLIMTSSETPIHGLMTYDSALTLTLQTLLKEKGIWVGALRPPSVPPNGDRLRINISVKHSFQDIDQLLEALKWAYAQVQEK